jgi:hypothetical protein
MYQAHPAMYVGHPPMLYLRLPHYVSLSSTLWDEHEDIWHYLLDGPAIQPPVHPEEGGLSITYHPISGDVENTSLDSG